jgi:hypothetical protein
MRMMKSSSSLALENRPAWRGRTAVRALTVGAVLWLASAASAQTPMNHHPDADCDGLVYAQEHVLHTLPDSEDTDRDGFSDLEEIARHSSPRIAALVPDPTKRIGVGLTAHAQTNGVHVLVATFMSDMDLRSKRLKVGILAHGQLYTFPTSYLAAHSTLSWHPASVGAGCVVLIDLTIDPSLVHALGHLTVWAKAGLVGAPGATSADSLHLLSIAGIVVYAMPVTRGMLPMNKDQGTTAGGSIYVPLLPSPGGSGTGGNGSGSGGGGVPASWEPGEVCFQRTSLVGADGAAVTNEVVEAECLGGWDGFCPPNCSSTVGSTFRTVDPLGLIGG